MDAGVSCICWRLNASVVADEEGLLQTIHGKTGDLHQGEVMAKKEIDHTHQCLLHAWTLDLGSIYDVTKDYNETWPAW